MYRLLSFMACACVCLGLSDVVQADSAPVAKPPTAVCEGNQNNLQSYLNIHEVLFSERWGNADLVSKFDQIGYRFLPKAALSATH
jgi:hypothetical protein